MFIFVQPIIKNTKKNHLTLLLIVSREKNIIKIKSIQYLAKKKKTPNVHKIFSES